MSREGDIRGISYGQYRPRRREVCVDGVEDAKREKGYYADTEGTCRYSYKLSILKYMDCHVSRMYLFKDIHLYS